MSPTITSRLHPARQQRVGPAVDADEHRLEVAHVRPDDREVALVAGPARDDERVPLAEARLERRELDALGRAAAPRRAGSAACSRRTPRAPRSRGPAARPAPARAPRLPSERPFARQVPLRKTLAPRTLTSSPSLSSSNSGAPGASISRTPPRTSSSGPGFGKRPVCELDTLTTTRTPDSSSSSAETRSMSWWSMIATSSGPRRPTRFLVRRPRRARPVNSMKLIAPAGRQR